MVSGVLLDPLALPNSVGPFWVKEKLDEERDLQAECFEMEVNMLGHFLTFNIDRFMTYAEKAPEDMQTDMASCRSFSYWPTL